MYFSNTWTNKEDIYKVIDWKFKGCWELFTQFSDSGEKKENNNNNNNTTANKHMKSKRLAINTFNEHKSYFSQLPIQPSM